MYEPRAFSKSSGFGELFERMGLPPLPSAEDIRSTYPLISWDTTPGDVIIHHPLTLHYAAGNATADTRRRAIAIRYLGDDARWDSRPGTFMEKDSVRQLLRDPARFQDGDRLETKDFPTAYVAEKQASEPSGGHCQSKCTDR